ncbi:hypothetical protein BLJAPNOD_05126 [Ensifer sp. M14]|nr:hypothetical protein BLJAPNOD_05126 [Ensifer sp. M14]
MHTARCSGSSRSADCCRLPHPPIMRSCQAQRRAPSVGTQPTRNCHEGRDTADIQRELPGLRRAQGLATVTARGLRHRPLHSRSAYEVSGAVGHYSRQTDPHDDQRQGRPMPTRPGEPSGLCSSTKHLVAFGFHLCGDLAGLRPRGLRYRCLRSPYRRLAVKPDCPCRLCARCPRPGDDRRPVHRGGLVHHSDRGSQYVSIRYTERLAEARSH